MRQWNHTDLESPMDERIGRLRESWRKRAPLELVLTFIGYSVYVVGALSVVGAIFLFTSIDEKDPGFPAGEGFLKVIKGYGVGLFVVTAVVCYYLGRWLLESRVAGARRNVAARYEASRIATLLAADPDFQSADTVEWRERAAFVAAPELREYAESDDWNDRRFAQQTIKEAWALCLRRRDEN